jgi:hypothetical protein
MGDKRAPGTIVSVPFVGMEYEETQELGGSFAEFVQRLGES